MCVFPPFSCLSALVDTPASAMCLPVSPSAFVQPCSIHRLLKVGPCDARAHLRSPTVHGNGRKVDLCDASAHLRSVQPCSIHRLRIVAPCDATAHVSSVQPCSIHRLRIVDLCDARPHLRSVQPCSIHRLRIVDLCDTYAHLRSTVTVRVRAFLAQLCFWLECVHPICFLCFTFVPSGCVLLIC
jgi:hypothetical protein